MEQKTIVEHNPFLMPPLILPRTWSFYPYQPSPSFEINKPHTHFNNDILYDSSKNKMIAQNNNERVAPHNCKFHYEMFGKCLFDCPESKNIDAAQTLIKLNQYLEEQQKKEMSLIEILRTTLSK
jgi:hypothetical protein